MVPNTIFSFIYSLDTAVNFIARGLEPRSAATYLNNLSPIAGEGRGVKRDLIQHWKEKRVAGRDRSAWRPAVDTGRCET
jgi:hypothetical protein